MTNIDKFIEDALAGGWVHINNYDSAWTVEQVILDTAAWKAVGKIRKWRDSAEDTFEAQFTCWEAYFEATMRCIRDGYSIEKALSTVIPAQDDWNEDMEQADVLFDELQEKKEESKSIRLLVDIPRYQIQAGDIYTYSTGSPVRPFVRDCRQTRGAKKRLRQTLVDNLLHIGLAEWVTNTELPEVTEFWRRYGNPDSLSSQSQFHPGVQGRLPAVINDYITELVNKYSKR